MSLRSIILKAAVPASVGLALISCSDNSREVVQPTQIVQSQYTELSKDQKEEYLEAFLELTFDQQSIILDGTNTFANHQPRTIRAAKVLKDLMQWGRITQDDLSYSNISGFQSNLGGLGITNSLSAKHFEKYLDSFDPDLEYVSLKNYMLDYHERNNSIDVVGGNLELTDENYRGFVHGFDSVFYEEDAAKKRTQELLDYYDTASKPKLNIASVFGTTYYSGVTSFDSVSEAFTTNRYLHQEDLKRIFNSSIELIGTSDDMSVIAKIIGENFDSVDKFEEAVNSVKVEFAFEKGIRKQILLRDQQNELSMFTQEIVDYTIGLNNPSNPI